MDEPKYNTHLWAFMPKSNKLSLGKEDITQIKASFSSVLTVTNENECRDPLLIKDKMAIKLERNRTKRYTILIPKTTPKFNYFAIYFNLIPL